jgi:hypothetical protein
VLLKVVAFTWDVADDFKAICETYFSNFTHRRVRLLRRGCIDACTNAALLRVTLEVKRFGAFDFRLPGLPDELLDRWHRALFPFLNTCMQGCPLAVSIRVHHASTTHKSRIVPIPR